MANLPKDPSVRIAVDPHGSQPLKVASPPPLSTEPSLFSSTYLPSGRNAGDDIHESTDEYFLSKQEGTERFKAFDERVHKLNMKLKAFADAVRLFGSGIGLIGAARQVQSPLLEMRHLFRHNAMRQFDDIRHAPCFTARQNAEANDIEKLPKYRASCLRDFQGQLKTPAIAKYINDFTEDIGEHMDTMKDSLDTFLVAIRASQERTVTGLQNLSTVATFFSSVTATTIQISFSTHGSLLSDCVNALWMSSLVFSIASAIGAQLAYHWRTSQYRSLRIGAPWWVAVWIIHTPLCFLVVSVIAFALGLCLFTYSSDQSRVVKVLVTTFTVITSPALIGVGFWIVAERWIQIEREINRQFPDTAESPPVARRFIPYLFGHTSIDRPDNHVTVAANRLNAAILSVAHVPRALAGRSASIFSTMFDNSSRLDHRDEESLNGSITNADSPTQNLPAEGWRNALDRVTSNLKKSQPEELKDYRGDPTQENKASIMEISAPMPVMNSPNIRGIEEKADNGDASDTAMVVTPQAQEHRKPEKGLLKGVAKQVVRFAQRSEPAPWPMQPVQLPSAFSESQRVPNSYGAHPSHSPGEQRLEPKALGDIQHQLIKLRPREIPHKHKGLVKHAQFSPNGQLLATCAWDKTALIWKVGPGPNDMFELLHTLKHVNRWGAFVSQVAWSPAGDKLLTRQVRAIKIWDPEKGDYREKTVRRQQHVESIVWMPKGAEFISVEWCAAAKLSRAENQSHRAENITGSELVVISVDGVPRKKHCLDRLKVWDIVVTPTEDRIVDVATLLWSSDNIRPAKSRGEKRILIYNLTSDEIECQVPVLQEIRDVTLTEQGNHVLVSYENRTPPQTWRINTTNKGNKACLELAHTYFTNRSVEFAGPSYFGGEGGNFVLCASKGGNIYIWERASGILLHSLKAPDKELTCIAWNRKSADGFMFLSAAHDGMVMSNLTNPDHKKLGDFKALCFDVYGTLIDWESGIIDALQPLLSQSAEASRWSREETLKAFDVAEGELQVANPTMIYSTLLAHVHAKLASQLSLPTTPELDTAFGLSVRQWKPFPDTCAALAKLSTHYKLVVLSNVDKETFGYTRKILESEGGSFSLVVTAQDVGSYKPDERNFNLRHDHEPANKLGLSSSYIARENAITGRGHQAKYTFTFPTLGAMAEAVEAEHM
ncbi:BRCA1 carboxy-terminus (BRCT) domain protein [Ceratobasidium sp. AG-Ba]|nr:BRCA1 carboxy-terminus (BRCT) domain protein [Ceratobasidium sp. AG-Ba]